jgi:hypothetical protein
MIINPFYCLLLLASFVVPPPFFLPSDPVRRRR